MADKPTVVIVGGGAAGFFVAANLNHIRDRANIILIEKASKVLQKVKVSGGGRCNVTNVCAEPEELVKNYPRGNRELLGPFHTFNPSHTIQWFEDRGVKLKTEEDGRVFPTTDDSQSIVNCLYEQAMENEVSVRTSEGLVSIHKKNNHQWVVETTTHQYLADFLVVTTGNSETVMEMLKKSGLEMTKLVPSLFTFNSKHPLLSDMMGVSFERVEVKVKGLKYKTEGPLLITHWGLSGPAILKVSSFLAKELNELNYKFDLEINFTSFSTEDEVMEELEIEKLNQGKKQLKNVSPFNLPAKFWKRILELTETNDSKIYAEWNKKEMRKVAAMLFRMTIPVHGKSTFKEEFVTCGGVSLKEIDFKNFSSKKHPNLFLAGEVLDIDGVTGGFNFQAAWTGGWIVAKSIRF